MKMTKPDIIAFVKHQTGVELVESDALNRERNILHAQIKRNNYISVATALMRKNIHFESHVKDYYFIYVK